MPNIDLAPLYRATVGFDRIADMMDRVLAGDGPQSGFPPYNIEKIDENAYRISLAVAGFAEEELKIEAKEGELIVSASRTEEESDARRNYLHRGIATRSFERRFQLADHVSVTGATHENGMLHIDLVREVPEALKPRRIEISKGAIRVPAIEGKARAGT